MSWTDHREQVTAQARAIAGGGVIVVTKDAWIWAVIGTVLGWIGATTKDEFVHQFGTAIGPVIAIPREVGVRAAMDLLYHECRHVRQASWFGLCIPYVGPWLGLPLYGVLYLLLPFPIGIAWFRLWFELDADRNRWRHMVQQGSNLEIIKAKARRTCENVTSRKYLYSWPRAHALKLFEKAANKAFYQGMQKAA